MSVFRFPKTNIFESAQPFFYMAKLLGHAVYSIKGDIFKGEIEITLLDFLYGTSLLILNGYCLYLSVLYGFKRSSSIVLDIGAYFVTNGVLILAIVSMVLHNVLRHRIWRIILVMHECDQKVSLTRRYTFLETFFSVYSLYYACARRVTSHILAVKLIY
jgi:hypothetical protein